jgi:hypothetical protein
MKLTAFKRSILFAFLFLIFNGSHAQDFSSPGSYMSYMSDKMQNVNQSYMNYLSAVSHGKSARKVEKLRTKVADLIYNTRGEINSMPPLKGDRSLKDATAAYLKTCYIVFNEDYAKIVNMEEIAEQSYDAMEAYILAQQKAGEKLQEAIDKRNVIFREFAQKFNVRITDEKDELDRKMEKSDKINDYYNKLYLIFFKSSKQEAYLTQAINAGDVNGMEQNRNALLSYATAGLEELKDIGTFESDASLVTACRRVLNFYRELAEKKMEPFSNYVLAEDNFKKIKKSFDQKSQKSQADIDTYNKAIKEINKAGDGYNKANNEINKERAEMMELWNSTVKRFMDYHMPYAK